MSPSKESKYTALLPTQQHRASRTKPIVTHRQRKQRRLLGLPDRLGWLGSVDVHVSADRSARAPSKITLSNDTDDNICLSATLPINSKEIDKEDINPAEVSMAIESSSDTIDLTGNSDEFSIPYHSGNENQKQCYSKTNNKHDKSNSLGGVTKWECSQCTFFNQMTISTCEVCSAHRGSTRNEVAYPEIPTTSNQMWIDKYTPQTVNELCIAPNKIKELRKWLTSCISSRHSKRESNISPLNCQVLCDAFEMDQLDTKMMILVGSPGIGKSTMVTVMAEELNLELIKWNDVHGHFYKDTRSPSDLTSCLPYQSELESFKEFLLSSGAGLESLSSLEVDHPINENNKFSSNKNATQRKGTVILIEEIPYLFNAEAAQAFRHIMEIHVQRTVVPTVFIFSDVYEGKHKPEDLERLIPSHILYSRFVQILHIQPVTKAKMKKCIEAIAKREGLVRLPSNFIDELHLSSGGDLRHAIFALQFRYASKHIRAISINKEFTDHSSERDVKLSSFHALGKLLYAKRKPLEAKSKMALFSESIIKWHDGRDTLEFIPEQILERTDMSLSSAISFLSYHSPDFFTDITELSQGFDCLSDAAVFLERFGQDDGPFPMDYAASMGGRAIATANIHPAPSAFRQLSTPKIYSVLKKRKENEIKMQLLRKRLSLGSKRVVINENVGSSHQFVIDSLSYLRSVIPQDVNHVLANLHSCAKDSTAIAPVQIEQNSTIQDQRVLIDDDLIDDDDR